MLTLPELADKLEPITGSTVPFRVYHKTHQVLLARVEANDTSISLDVVFENTEPNDFTRTYLSLRRAIGARVPVSVAGYQFTAALHDTTVLPEDFDPRAYANDIITLTFTVAKTASAYTGMVAVPVPEECVAHYGVKWKYPPHITLAYMPTVTPAQANAISWTLRRVLERQRPIDVRAHKTAVFGDGKLVVLVEATPKLRAWRDYVVHNVHRIYPGIVDTQTHAVWRPHITLGDTGKTRVRDSRARFTADCVEVNLKDGPVFQVPVG